MIVEEKIPQVKERLGKSPGDLYLSLLSEGRSVYLNAWGMSMYPFIKNGDRIKIVPVNTETIKIGDIIAVNPVRDQIRNQRSTTVCQRSTTVSQSSSSVAVQQTGKAEDRSYGVNRKDKDGRSFFVHRVVRITECNGNKLYFTKGDAHQKGLDGPITKDLIAGKVTEIQREKAVINLEFPLYRYLNRVMAKLSLRYPRILYFLSRYTVLIIEWRLFLSKVKNRLKNGDPLIYNTEGLLLICACKDLSPELKDKALDLIKQGLHWENFSELAMRQGVTILVYNALRTIEPYARIPQFVLERLKSGYLFITSKLTARHEQMLELLSLFAKKDIPVIPLKGTLLSKRLYADIATRGLSVDFDSLIKEEDKERARILLQEAGYSLGQDREIEAWQWHDDFSKPGVAMIDLHWDITMMGRSQERIEGLWKGTRRVEHDNVSFYEFKEEELLLYLSAHLVNSSRFGQIRYICDINELLNRHKDKLNWESVIEKARKWRLSGSLYTAFKLTHQIFGAQVPAQAWKRLQPNFLTLFLIKLFVNKKVILRKGLRRRLIDDFLSYIFFELLEAHSLKEYFSIFKRVFFPPREAIGKRSYILRIFKGIGKLFKRVLA